MGEFLQTAEGWEPRACSLKASLGYMARLSQKKKKKEEEEEKWF